jgi:hypothetical protein
MRRDAAAPARTKQQFRILIDTCVWLDLAKDYHQQAQLGILEELIELGEISLIVPRVIVEEFARNRARVIDDSSRSLSTTLKRVKEAVDKFGDPRRKRMVLRQLNDVDHRLPTLGEAAVETVGRIEKLFAQSDIIETLDTEVARSPAGHRQASAISQTAQRHRRCTADRDVQRGRGCKGNTRRKVRFCHPQHEGFQPSEREQQDSTPGHRVMLLPRKILVFHDAR